MIIHIISDNLLYLKVCQDPKLSFIIFELFSLEYISGPTDLSRNKVYLFYGMNIPNLGCGTSIFWKI